MGEVHDLSEIALEKYRGWYGHEPEVAAYAPGRVEVLGNHTDYNDGYVLSAAIDCGTLFLASSSAGKECRLVAGDVMEEARFSLTNPLRAGDHKWPNYVMGVAVELARRDWFEGSFEGLFFGDVPIGSGLSSSAALEISAAIAISALSDSSPPHRDLARIGQRAEHEYVGALTGLLDQITSLEGKIDSLVYTDFRSFDVRPIPLPENLVLVTLDTRTRHHLSESGYNERRHDCEAAVAHFSLSRPVGALRDVTMEELERAQVALDPRVFRRAKHVIGENARVLTGVECVESDQIEKFGELMYASHESSRIDFENSCAELDWIVDAAHKLDWIIGARLSGGGFGGNAVLLTYREDADRTIEALQPGYTSRFRTPFDARVIRASDGARRIKLG